MKQPNRDVGWLTGCDAVQYTTVYNVWVQGAAGLRPPCGLLVPAGNGAGNEER